MWVPNCPPLIYFAFPKCASEWMRRELRLRPNNKFSPNGWHYCHIGYAHVQPRRWLAEHQIDPSQARMFTIVRNTYARLVSAYAYGRKVGLPYAKDKSFSEFIDMIYEHRHCFTDLPYSWMYMPFETYFEGVQDQVEVYFVEDLSLLIDFFHTQYGKKLKNYVVNRTPHDPVASFYDETTLPKVQEVYAYELHRFHFQMPT